VTADTNRSGIARLLRSHRAQRGWLLALYVIAPIVVSVQRGILAFPNDYAIFRHSFYNLLSGRDLYVLHSDQALDLFKYSPSFAVLFAPFAIMPFAVGLLAWNCLNTLGLYHVLDRLLPWEKARVAMLLVFPTMLRATQSSQSNALVATLIVSAFISLEHGRDVRAAIAIVVGAAIKIFPLAALALAMPHIELRRSTRFALLVAGTAIVVLALPLLFVPMHGLVAQYQSWRALEQQQATWVGTSVMGVLQEWFGWPWRAWPVQIAGTIVLLLPLVLRRDQWRDEAFRRRYLASLLVYMVLFNHKAERQSYVIALVGIAIWFVNEPRTPLRVTLMAVVFTLTSLIAALPAAIRADIGVLHRNAFPVALVWLLMQVELLGARRTVPDQGARPSPRAGDGWKSFPTDLLPE
jgi:hypothetical protein